MVACSRPAGCLSLWSRSVSHEVAPSSEVAQRGLRLEMVRST